MGSKRDSSAAKADKGIRQQRVRGKRTEPPVRMRGLQTPADTLQWVDYDLDPQALQEENIHISQRFSALLAPLNAVSNPREGTAISRSAEDRTAEWVKTFTNHFAAIEGLNSVHVKATSEILIRIRIEVPNEDLLKKAVASLKETFGIRPTNEIGHLTAETSASAPSTKTATVISGPLDSGYRR